MDAGSVPVMCLPSLFNKHVIFFHVLKALVAAEGPAAKVEIGTSSEYTGASVGAHAGEARVGPFAARAGVKVGAGVRDGVPEVDLGPVTVPCSVM